MPRKIFFAAMATLGFAGTAFAAEPIEGSWKRSNGTIIRYASTGGANFCGTVMSGEYKGKSIGCMAGKGGSYKGKVIKLDEGKAYSGTAKVSGGSMTLSGCVAAIFCKSETLARQ